MSETTKIADKTMRRVYGEARVVFEVRLPISTAYESVACEEPAKEAVICALQDCEIYLWGEDNEPVLVHLETHEDDIDIEEDEEE